MSAALIFDRMSRDIGQLTLSHPKKRNALSADMWRALPDLLENAAKLDGLRVLIVRGDGDHFASGADISEFETLYATQDSADVFSALIAQGLNALAAFPLPTIARISGSCIGGGCALALCCDVRIADSSSRFAITPAKIGLAYPYDDVVRLIDAVGVTRAKDLLLSARGVSPTEALEIGLITKLHPPEELADKVEAYAARLIALSGSSARMTKAMFTAYAAGAREQTQAQKIQFAAAFSGDDSGCAAG